MALSADQATPPFFVGIDVGGTNIRFGRATSDRVVRGLFVQGGPALHLAAVDAGADLVTAAELDFEELGPSLSIRVAATDLASGEVLVVDPERMVVKAAWAM